MATLIITNGDGAAELLQAAGRDDVILPWRDVLHEGPIVAGPLEKSSTLRASFLAGRFGLDADEVSAAFAERDATLRRHTDFETIELWFEHDLYDQLQLVQLLSFFADEGRHQGIRLVQADDFLGRQRPETILRFGERARAADEEDLDLADRVWADLAMPTPENVARRLNQQTDRLPFLEPALHRFLEELPARNGLSRTEATALAAIAAGATAPGRLFGLVLSKEEAAFMGDLSFSALLTDLAKAETPLIEDSVAASQTDDRIEWWKSARLALTEIGRAVLAGDADHVALNAVDRWWGGTRLNGRDVWRYDRAKMSLVPPRASAA
jgi:hypothetical protein